MADEPSNGNVLRFRVERLEHRLKGAEEATRWVAEKGQKANEQIRVHDEKFAELDRRVTAAEIYVADVPVVKAELADVKESLRAARNAGYAVVVALVGLAGTIFWQVGHP